MSPITFFLPLLKQGRWSYHMANRSHADSLKHKPPFRLFFFGHYFQIDQSKTAAMSGATQGTKSLHMWLRVDVLHTWRAQQPVRQSQTKCETEKEILREEPKDAEGRDSQCGPWPAGSRRPWLRADKLTATVALEGKRCPLHCHADRVPPRNKPKPTLPVEPHAKHFPQNTPVLELRCVQFGFCIIHRSTLKKRSSRPLEIWNWVMKKNQGLHVSWQKF